MTSRRDFLKIMLATSSAPAIIKIENLMRPIYVPPTTIIYKTEGWLWDDEEGLLMTAGSLRPNAWIQKGLVWTLQREVDARRLEKLPLMLSKNIPT